MHLAGEKHANDSPSNTVLRAYGSDLFWKAEEKGRIVFVSVNVLVATGFTAEDIYQGGAQFCLRHVHPEDVLTVKQAYTSLFETGDLFELDYRISGKDGVYHWIRDHALAISVEGGGKFAEGIISFNSGQRQQQEARRLEELARSTLDALSTHITILDQTGTIIAVNRAWREFARANGAVDQQVSEGTNYLAICDSTLSESSAGTDFATAIRAVIAGKQEKYSVEYPCDSPDEKRWFIGSVTRFFASGAVHVMVAHENITERKQIEETLRESEERYRLLFDDNPYPMWVYHLDTLDFLAVNDAAIHHYGYSRREFLGMSIKDLRPPEDLPALLEDVRLARLGNRMAGIWQHLKSDGSLIDVEITARTLNSKSERARLVLAIDITERKRAEIELRDAQKRIEGIINSAMDAIITVDANQHVLLFNIAAEQMFGYSAKEVLGQQLDRFIPERFRSSHQEHIPVFAQTQLTKRGTGDLGAIFGLRANGEEFPIEASISQVEAGGQRTFTVILRDVTERKRTEDALRSLATLVESSDDAIMGVTLETVLTSWNKGAEKVFGYTALEAVGQSMRMLIPAERKIEEHQILEKLKRGERIEHYETVQVRKDGERIDVSLTISPIRDGSGQIIGASKIARNITGRKRAEKALRESQERIAGIINSAMDAIITVDASQNVLLFNAAAEQMFGYSAKVVLGQSLDRFIPERFRPTHHKHITAFGQTHVTKRRMSELGALFGVRANGEEFPIEASISKIEAGDQRLYTVILRDISERKQAEEELRRSEERYRRLIETAPDMIYTLSAADGTITTMSPACKKITGWRPAEMLGKRFTTLIHPKDAKVGEVIFQQVLQGESPAPYELHILTKSGQGLLAEFVAIPQIENGKITGLLGMARDITERKHAEEEIWHLNMELEQRVIQRTAQLAAANHELESFSYSVSHDLRAPLRAIAGFSRILCEEYESGLPADAQQYLQRVQENAQQMGRLIDDLLAFSRLGRKALNKQLVAPDELVHAVLEELRDEYAQRQVKVVIGDLPVCQADPALLKQVFVNLLSNALKFTRQCEVAEIEVGCQRNEDKGLNHLYFVKDNGVGFDMHYAHKLFGVFQRLHRAEDFEGTGVGLAIVQRIIDRHGGCIWAESQPGQGTTFYFTIGEENK